MVAKAKKHDVDAKSQKRKKGAKGKKRGKSDTKNRKPLLFISHKHENVKIADVLRDWVEMSTGGSVEVFQSSSDQATFPRAGSDLKQELKNALWHAGAFVMLYTYPHLDWSYCTFEYGVANSSTSPDTRMILLQCCDNVPPLFAGQTSINLRDSGDVKKFVKQFLTDPKFFSEYGEAVSSHAPGGQMVTKLAEKLYKEVNSPDVMPPLTTPSDEEWPAFPFLQLQLDMKHIKTISDAATRADRLKVMCELIRKECTVSATDKYLAPIFGFAPGMDKDTKFGEFIRGWEEREDRGDAQSKWIEALGKQIMSAALWQFPPFAWELMEGAGGEWYAPMLTRVRRTPNKHMQFDIYFFRFRVGKNEKQRGVEVGIPEG
jgi:hypothetical protein